MSMNSKWLRQDTVNCVKGEIHNVLSVMRLNQRWASGARFRREIPLNAESSLTRAFKTLHEYLEGFDDLRDVDTVRFLRPFLAVVMSQDTSGPITGVSLSSIHKFLLYEFVTMDSMRARDAINLIATALAQCRFEATDANSDEVVLMKLLELLAHCLRCEAGRLIADEHVWEIFNTCFRISAQEGGSALLASTAENTLAHIVLLVFSRAVSTSTSSNSSAAVVAVDNDALPAWDEDDDDAGVGGVGGGGGDDDDESSKRRGSKGRPRRRDRSDDGVGTTAVLVQIMRFLSALTDPRSNSKKACVTGLSLINIVLETAGGGLGQHVELVAVMQGDLCKHLLHNSQTDNLTILNLTLRVVFNLFNSIKDHMKVQLEVFFTSVHLRIVESQSSSPEQRELALESLLEFCHEPALMLDLYINYDCDVQCTNLFETLCKALSRQAVPAEGHARLNVLHRLALEGLLVVIDSIARRCHLSADRSSASSSSTAKAFARAAATAAAAQHPHHQQRSLHEQAPFPPAHEFASSDRESLGNLSMSESDSDADSVGSAMEGAARGGAAAIGGGDMQWLAVARERTAQVLQRRKQVKRRLMLAADRFNEDTSGKGKWIPYAQELELLPTPRADPASVARFLYQTRGLDKQRVGEYLSKGPADKYPFNASVLAEYTALFTFSGHSFDGALRVFLQCFRMPGEAQCIDRLMEAFSKQLYAQCSETLPLADADAAFVLAFSTIMLNTDLHNPQIRDDRRMTFEQWAQNSRDINAGGSLPHDFMVDLYGSIKTNQIQLQFDVGDSGPGLGKDEWDGLIQRRQQTVASATFTPAAAARKNLFAAGLHERDMFQNIADATITAISVVFERTCDGTLAQRAVQGFYNYARICAYFGMTRPFNNLVISLLREVRKFLDRGVQSLEWDEIDSGAAGGDDNDIVHVALLGDTSDAVASSAERQRQQVARSGRQHSPAAAAAVSAGGGRGATAGPASPPMHAASSGAPGDADDGSDTSDGGDEVPHATIDDADGEAAPMARGLVALHTVLTLVRTYGDIVEEAWTNVVECVLTLGDLRVLPQPMIEIDDFSDSCGAPMPASPFALQSGYPGVRTGNGRFSAAPSPQAAPGAADGGDSNSGDGAAAGGGGLWSSFSSFVWSAVAPVYSGPRLRGDAQLTRVVASCDVLAMFSRSRDLAPASLRYLVRALLLCRDPAVLQAGGGDKQQRGLADAAEATWQGGAQSVGGAGLAAHHVSAYLPRLANGQLDVAVFQCHAVLAVELATRVTLANEHRVAQIGLWPLLHAYIERTLTADGVWNSAPFLLERVAVNLLRVVIRLMHREELRNSFLPSLQLLTLLPDAAVRPLANRLASGLLILVKTTAAVCDLGASRAEFWRVILSLLARAAVPPSGRPYVWEVLCYIVDRGHVDIDNFDICRTLLVCFVEGVWPKPVACGDSSPSSADHSRAVPALHLLQKALSTMLTAAAAATSAKNGEGGSQGAEEQNMDPTAVAEAGGGNGDAPRREREAPAEAEAGAGTPGGREEGGDDAEAAATASAPVIPSFSSALERSWLQALASLLRFCGAGGGGSAIAKTATHCIQQLVLLPPHAASTISSSGWLSCFKEVLFLLPSPGHLTSTTGAPGLNRLAEDEVRLRNSSLITRAFLHNVDSIATLCEFSDLWVDLVKLMARDMKRGMESEGVLYESTFQAFVNVIMVMRHGGVFEQLRQASSGDDGEDALAATWRVLNESCPAVTASVQPLITGSAEIQKPETAEDMRGGGPKQNCLPAAVMREEVPEDLRRQEPDNGTGSSAVPERPSVPGVFTV